MAEYTRMRNNVLGYPIYGLPWVIAFPALDEDGDPVTGLTPDSEISKNGNTAIDCHNEGVEIVFDTATNKGMYYLDLTGSHTGTEMAADVVAVTVYFGVTTTQATAIFLYPKKLPKILTNKTVGATGNDTTHVHIPDGVAIDDFYNGCVLHMNESGNDECRMITDYVASTKLATLNLALDAAPTASTSTYDVYMTEVAIASILALMVGMVPNAVAGAANGLVIAGSNAATAFATLTSTGALTAGSVSVGGTTTLTGNVTLSGTLGVGATTLASLTVTGALTAGSIVNNGVFTQTGAATFTAGIISNITGNLSGSVGSVASVVEGSITIPQSLQVILSAVAGKASGGGSITIKYRNQANDKDRVTLTVDADGNRTGSVLSLD